MNIRPGGPGGESPGDDHVSARLSACRPEDLVGIRVCRTQPGNETNLSFIEVEFAEDGEVITHLLPPGQAAMLADAIGGLLVPRRTDDGMGAYLGQVS